MDLVLDAQSQEVVARHEEFVLRQQELASTYEYAQRALMVESENIQRDREAERSERRDHLTFAGFVLAMIIILVMYALHIGKDAIAMEALKDIALFGVGGIGGYAVARRKATESTHGEE